MYKSNSKNVFQLEHCWRILRDKAKWLIQRDNLTVRTRQLTTQSCHNFANSINLDEDNDDELWRSLGETHRQEGRKGEIKEKKEL